MKAKDIKPGDVIDGWTVTDICPNAEASFWYGNEEDGEFTSDIVVLLTLERPTETALIGLTNPDGMWALTETRRTWYPADEEMSRGE